MLLENAFKSILPNFSLDKEKAVEDIQNLLKITNKPIEETDWIAISIKDDPFILVFDPPLETEPSLFSILVKDLQDTIYPCRCGYYNKGSYGIFINQVHRQFLSISSGTKSIHMFDNPKILLEKGFFKLKVWR